MDEQERPSGQRGAAEEQSGVPLTPTENQANQRPPSSTPGEPTDASIEKAGGVARGGSAAGGAEPGSRQDDRP